MDSQHASDVVSIFQMFWLYRSNPFLLLVTIGFVIGYAARKFGTPTRRLSDDPTILPPRYPAVQTTYLRYRISRSLYVLTWLFFFSIFAFIPDLLNSALAILHAFGIELGGVRQGLSDLLSSNQTDLPHYLPILAFIFMYVVGRLPGFSTVEEIIRDGLNDLAKIPLEARRMSSQLHDMSPVMPPAFLAILAADTWGGNLRTRSRALYDDWVKLRYLARQIESWPAQPDYSRFALRYSQERTALLQSKAKLGEALTRLDALLATAVPATNPLIEAESQQRAGELTPLLENFATFLCYGILSSFTTKRARDEALSCIGYPVTRAPDEAFPLDAAALALVLVPVFATIGLATALFMAMPDRWFNSTSPVMAQLDVRGCLRWAFWGTLMHFSTVVAVLQSRRVLRGSAFRAWLEDAGDAARPYGLYLFAGLVGFAVGGAIALIASALGPRGFAWHAFAWGSVTFVTGGAVVWHIDAAKRAIAELNARSGPVVAYPMGAPAGWQCPITQGFATAAVGLLTYFYILDLTDDPFIDWRFCLFIVVATGAVGAFLGRHLRRTFWHRETHKQAIRDRAPSSPAPPVHDNLSSGLLVAG